MFLLKLCINYDSGSKIVNLLASDSIELLNNSEFEIENCEVIFGGSK